MKKYLYWAENSYGKSYFFMSLASLALGLEVKDENGNPYTIIDKAIEEVRPQFEKPIKYEKARIITY